MENLAEKALSRLLNTDPDGSTKDNALFKSLQIGAVISDVSGRIQLSNEQALKAFGLYENSDLSDAHLWTDSGEPLSAPFLATLHGKSGLTVQQCFKGDVIVNLAILTLQRDGASPKFLIVFMGTSWVPEAKELLATRFDFTDVETEIIEQFIAGVSLKKSP